MRNLHNNYQNHPYYMNSQTPAARGTETAPAPAIKDRFDLTNTFRTLWFEHVMWTRSVITSTASNNPDLNDTITRLLRNPADFAAVLEPYYGKENADKFKQLFTDHLTIANDLLLAHKARDMHKAVAMREKWYENAANIAAALSKMNPFWPENEFAEMMNEHLKMTEEEMLERLGGDYARDIKTFGMIQEQALKMADMMSYGLIRQFGF